MNLKLNMTKKVEVNEENIAEMFNRVIKKLDEAKVQCLDCSKWLKQSEIEEIVFVFRKDNIFVRQDYLCKNCSEK